MKFISIVEPHHAGYFNEALGVRGQEKDISKEAWAFLKKRLPEADLSFNNWIAMFLVVKNKRIQDKELWKILEDSAIYISQTRGEHLIFGNYIDQYYAVFRHNLVSQNFKKAIYDTMIESMGRYEASDIIDGIELLYFRNYDQPHEY